MVKDPKPSNSSRKPKVLDKDREFSLSSVTFKADVVDGDVDHEGDGIGELPKIGNLMKNKRGGNRPKFSKFSEYDDDDYMDD
jgi:hypothetical protein